MKCPTCQAEMIVVEHADIELDYCVECEGIWFDSSELELLFQTFDLDEEADLDRLTRPAEAGVAESARRCPLCPRKMEKVRMGTDPGILIDRCPNGDGLWFDGGELGRVIQLVLDSPGSEGKVVSFLGETFRGPPPESDVETG
ncbi:MAG: zf-TFIIB domain-containing protein [Kiritimatiellaeota bacterium]|nr:zf-TFIIB domain-containing protein [Kiritimatiellota bacterium]